MKILISGITGFIGRYIANRLISQTNHTVIGIARKKVSHKTPYKIFYFDLANENEFSEKVDVIIHAAAQSPADGILTHDYVSSNINATLNLIQLAKQNNINRIIYLSAISIYGSPGQSVIDENSPIISPSPYGMSKFMCELLLNDESLWLSSIVLRLPGVIGKGAKTPWIATLAQRMSNNENISIYNPNALFNNIVCISDLADFIINLIHGSHFGFKVYTLASKDPLTISDTVNTLKQSISSQSRINHLY